ncbi:hypothetical protein, partial [Maribacter flavus]|uniref:hypothetical protein n=1 Tax=Maribacter flavus TaxID=1658664 RepID=UPI003D33BFE2
KSQKIRKKKRKANKKVPQRKKGPKKRGTWKKTHKKPEQNETHTGREGKESPCKSTNGKIGYQKAQKKNQEAAKRTKIQNDRQGKIEP